MIWVYLSIFFVGLSIVVKLSILVTSSAASPPHRPEIWISRCLPEARFSLVACKCNPESAMYAQNISKSLGCVCWWVPKRNNRPTRRIERLSPWALTNFQGGCWSKDCQSEVWRGDEIRRDFSGSCPGEASFTSKVAMMGHPRSKWKFEWENQLQMVDFSANHVWLPEGYLVGWCLFLYQYIYIFISVSMTFGMSIKQLANTGFFSSRSGGSTTNPFSDLAATMGLDLKIGYP